MKLKLNLLLLVAVHSVLANVRLIERTPLESNIMSGASEIENKREKHEAKSENSDTDKSDYSGENLSDNKVPKNRWPFSFGMRANFSSSSSISSSSPSTAQTDFQKHIWKNITLPIQDSDVINKRKNQTSTSQPKQRQRFCQPEVFYHEYLAADSTETTPMTNTWRRAKVGERAATRYLCLKPNGLPVTRACNFNTTTGQPQWEDISKWPKVRCISRVQQHIATASLSELHNEISDESFAQQGIRGRKRLLQRVSSALENPEKIIPADVHYFGKILREMSAQAQEPELAHDIVSICSRLMVTEATTLQLSNTINATNSLLDSFEQYMDDLVNNVDHGTQNICNGKSLFASSTSSNDITNATVSPLTTMFPPLPGNHTEVYHAVETADYPGIGVRAHLSGAISVFFVNPDCAQITGIALYNENATVATTHPQYQLFKEARGKFLYRFISWNETAEDVLREPEVQLATFVPFSLWQSISSELRSQGRKPMIILKVYSSDCFFIEKRTLLFRKPMSKIISISIPGHAGPFNEVLPFILRNKHFSNSLPADGTGCSYWNYDTWVNDGVKSPPNAQRMPVILCGSYHLTQFSFLVGGNYRQSDTSDEVLITPLHQRALDIISLLGCSLSLLGLLGIWLTALIFPSWRKNASTKVLLNLCLALTLQIVLFVFVNTDDMSEYLVEERIYVSCVLLGAFMQYSLLVLFLWMLIVAILQFQRYVTVIGVERPKHYILKSALIAWGLPLIPTLLVALIDPHSYIPTEEQIENAGALCYPSGYGLTFGVVLPVSLISIGNLVIFIYVFYSISHSLNQSSQKNERMMVKKQIRLSVLLFFLLGLSWIFGIFAFMRAGIVFSYLFCITATLQGLVLFIFFVVLDEKARQLWADLLFNTSEKKLDERRREARSITTTSTGTH